MKIKFYFLISSLCFWLAVVAQTKNTTLVKEITSPASQKLQAKVNNYVRKQMRENHIPGLSLAVVKDGNVVYAKGYGMSNLELSTPATANTAFAIYSITKTFTAVAILKLSEDGKIALEDKISKYITDLPETWSGISIRHLLTHTSGLPDICEASPDPCQTPNDYTQQEIIKLVTALPLKFASGEKWEYSNTAYFLLGLLIEKVTSKGYAHFLQENIFKPLQMLDTRLENYKEIIANRADGYSWKNSTYQNAFRVSPTLSFSLAGIVSTVLDLAKYDAALYTEQLLKKSTLELMFTKVTLKNGETIDHGLGWGMTPFRGHKRVGHSGGHVGFATTLTRLIDDKISVIILSNADSEGYKIQNGFLISEIANEIASYYFKQ